MAAAQDVENPNPPGSSASQNADRGPQIAESQRNPSQLRIAVTVLRAHNLPHIKRRFGLKFFVTVTSQANKKKTSSVPRDGEMVQWNENLETFIVQPSSRLVLRLYAERFARRDILIGMCEMISVESQTDVPFVLTNGDRQLIQPVTVYLTVVVSPNPVLPINAANLQAIEVNESPPTEFTKPPMAQDSANTTRSAVTTGFENLSPQTDGLPSEMSTPLSSAADRPVGMSPENALQDADKAMTTINLSNTWEGALERVKWVMDTVSSVAELHPYAKMAYDLLFAIPKTILEQFQRDDNVRTLLAAVHDAFDFTKQNDRFETIERVPRQAQILTLMLQHVCNCCDFIRSYAKDSQLWKRVLKQAGSQVDKKIEDFRTTFLELHKTFLDEATITTEITALQILDDVGIISTNVDKILGQLDGMATQLNWVSSQVSNVELDAIIREIPYGTGSRFTPGKGCLTGTRTTFLDFITNWVNDSASEHCLVLFGQAGTGKSSIAHEIARRFNKMHRLTSSFIFLRKEQSKREAHHLFTTLARDLSDRYPSFKTALGNVVKNNSSLRAGTRDYDTLFQSLILEPLKEVHIVGPIVVVIDALDESGDATGITGLHTFLAENLTRLPSNFRVLITSRPEDRIESALVGAPSVRIKRMNDSVLAVTTHVDILAFFQAKLPSDEFRDHGDGLARKAEGLFQWAAVAIQFIQDPPGRFVLSKKKVIRHLLKRNANRAGQDPLDELYKEVLEGYFTDRETRLLFRAVVGQLLTAIEPLSIHSLTTLRRHAVADDEDDDSDAVAVLLRRLGSLLSNVNSHDENLPIIPLHTSFRDFLTNNEKSGEFCVSLRDAHRDLAHSCLGLLLKALKFNLCHLDTSYLANENVTDLGSRIKEHIPPALSYACRFWDDHLDHVSFEADLFEKLRTFFEKKLLFWLEALSLMNDVGLALAACSALNVWLASDQGQAPRTELEKFRSFVNDASVFIRYFGRTMAKSAPHIYLSALPFAPTSSVVSAHYSSSFPQILHVERGQLSHWPSLELVISTVGSGVNSIALSPDGQCIVSGSDDRTIHVFNATTGETVAGPFTGHTEGVMSVAFSPDGQRIVSGSEDKTIRVWNATTGETVAGPFTGHTDLVSSVAFSPDGQHIVSGSYDKTICVWNATTGETAAGPFTGHTDWVNSVAFSPDGQHIVSGSSDQTICVWNATTGEIVAGPFTGHTGPVWSVAFSPDGQCIVSGYDQTIHVCNATTGEIVAGPFTGHTDPVDSVAFSPDGQHIVSGSSDQTICVWNAVTGETVAGPFTGHTSWVTSVALSPDGQRIVSGSNDRTIRVWNATMGETAAGPFTGHTDGVTSMAFSPDGQHIVSGSYDKTICVWNAMTGEMVAGPFTGHTKGVTSVAFSPDGQHIVSGSNDKTICVWNAMTGETVAGPFTGHTNLVLSVAFSPDGQHLVSCSEDGTIHVWNAMTGETVAGPFTGHTDPVDSVAFSPDGQHIVSGSSDQTICVWNAMTGETVAGPFTGHTNRIMSVAFSPDGQCIVSGSYDKTIHVWNTTTGETVAGPFTGHTGPVWYVAFSPDGQHIVSGSYDQTIRVWNATTGETVAGPFTGHTGPVWSMAFSPDGQCIVSGSYDKTIRVWNISTGGTVAGPSTGHVDSVESVALSPYGNTRHAEFTDHSIIDDEGWLCGDKGELLVWIPPPHRENLHRPSNVWVAGAGELETRMDLSTFVHGPSWATCIDAQVDT